MGNNVTIDVGARVWSGFKRFRIVSIGRLGEMVINLRAPRRGTFLIIPASVHGCETWSLT